MEVSNEILRATVAVPSTMLVIASVAGATSTMTGRDLQAVRRGVYVSGGVLVAAALVTGSAHMVIAVGIAVATMIAITYPHLVQPLSDESVGYV